ncbi:MAG: 30S ribosomal protein S4 [Candidatus Magasanikbacteria bacterium GW2011_GWD2_43_18]|nr:MAG: 30S ribosomal protein S4 [Candidatus Magasanikbacteria bacterium GW2011_GWC2_42_27]KKT03385.1 MAG: 30S ribosomal protein S4 [Candidatus Magasanikbacteria bacterium GW2011_GWD2_43_18]KKT25265.1 MAG: 30S ribosomal protein S4 [Candidatus Magasanikbacteria bacterium GW2011_GWA2_43_9]HBB38577.1 30S ribosomal protein S4 [Candidatus Magasanikbacteria bacterium]HCC13876.1 30S ribosomal protein S4 [Candidatus Magasanikbacteria bacterium]
MGRYTGPKNKIARRFGINLGLKSNAAKVAKRLNQKPGQHGARRRTSLSSFGKQLDEKQKAKFIYGLRERQFRGYVEEANRREGDSGVNLNQVLESRLDNVVYRMGFAVTRAQARQFVNHGMFTVNAKKLNIPSYLVKVGDEIQLRENKQSKKIFETITEQLTNATAPSWLKVDAAGKKGTVLTQPIKDDLDNVFDVKLIIEYYSTR